MFLWPDGDITGSVQWAELAAIVGSRADDTVTEAGYKRLEVLLAEHFRALTPEPDEPADAGDEPEPEPDEPAEPVRRGRRAARPEED